MKQTRTIEIVTGFFIVLGFLALYIVATRATNIHAYGEGHGYSVTASFTNIGGLKVRAPVTMSGVAIGRVTNIQLDPNSYNAIVTLEIKGTYNQIPDDTTASILTAGLLGEQYIGLSPGGSETFLKQNSRITYTQSAIVLENLIGKFLSSGKGTGGN